MNKKLIKIILSWLFVFIWMIIIFNFSNMNNEESNTQSKEIIDKVVDTTIDTSNKIGIITVSISSKEKQTIIYKLNKPLRKMHAFYNFFYFSNFYIKCLNSK